MERNGGEERDVLDNEALKVVLDGLKEQLRRMERRMYARDEEARAVERVRSRYASLQRRCRNRRTSRRPIAGNVMSCAKKNGVQVASRPNSGTMYCGAENSTDATNRSVPGSGNLCLQRLRQH